MLENQDGVKRSMKDRQKSLHCSEKRKSIIIIIIIIIIKIG